MQVAGRARKAGPAGKAGEFAAELDRVGSADEAGPADSVDQAGAVLCIGGLLAAQSVDPEGAPDHKERQRRAQRGNEMLDRLEEIRAGLLVGAVPKDRLQELAQLVRKKRERGADPIVSRLLDEIEPHAEVELAKLSRRINA